MKCTLPFHPLSLGQGSTSSQESMRPDSAISVLNTPRAPPRPRSSHAGRFNNRGVAYSEGDPIKVLQSDVSAPLSGVAPASRWVSVGAS